MLIGRKKQQAELLEAYNSDDSRFVALYGRRRVGKTYLIKQTFKDKFTFSHSGLANGSLQEQLYGWRSSLENAGYVAPSTPKHWLEAFDMLKELIRQSSAKKKVVFIDEMPWMDTPRSKFVTALEFFWNGWASMRDDILLIICGSATSWIINKIFRNHGGLHNRITHEMYLAPFTLGETEEFLQANGFLWPRLSILQIYSMMGGVPYYLSLLDKTQGVEANVDRLFFAERGELKREYDRLYSSLFRNSEIYMRVIETLAKCKQGMTRKEISTHLNLKSGGTLTKVLRELINCDFVRGYNTREKKIKQKDQIYQLTDLYTLFYMSFCHPGTTDVAYWTHQMGKPRQNTWYGLAFERICMLHIPQIKKSLGIEQIYTEYYSWRSKCSTPAAQIDLLIERADHLINLCEIKYSQSPYSITKEEELRIRTRMADFVEETGVRHGILPTLITTFGIRPTAHSAIAQVQLTMDDLFT